MYRYIRIKGKWLAVFVVIAIVTAGYVYRDLVGYLTHAAVGHMRIMLAREDISALLAHSNNHALSKQVRHKLKLVQQVRDFAIHELQLPHDAGFRRYVQLDRNTLGWNVYAAPEFSVQPHLWCFPLVGCIVYRGYFDKNAAQSFVANNTQLANMDVWIAPFSGYSSLGYFEDPLISTQLRRSDATLAALVIHEIAHQQLYVPGKSHINEAFAKLVEHKGVELWLRSTNRLEQLAQYRQHRRQVDTRVALVLDAKEQLQVLYTSDLSRTQQRTHKAQILAALETALCTDCQKPILPEDTKLNNAFFVPYSTYFGYVDDMEKLFHEAGENFAQFYVLVAQTYSDTQ